jgi:hypothetical protein
MQVVVGQSYLSKKQISHALCKETTQVVAKVIIVGLSAQNVVVRQTAQKNFLLVCKSVEKNDEST